MSAYQQVLLFALAGLLTALVLLGIGRYVNARLNTEPARRPFESGEAPQVHAWSRFHVRFLNYALIFLLFDMEMVFMYPWAVVFLDEGWKAFTEMGMFITILVLGILYAWRERAFDWD
ncbi:NADH-quinone oxidoreductase subunit A [Thermithiobacillus plumbiphilus]|uniref:NADH-quinone oxidoreductase subunit n=1 Tax=Thermithiobacillus plumbiphilus TaxID=1729899 RepID=A0ABU9D6F3_9PROT